MHVREEISSRPAGPRRASPGHIAGSAAGELTPLLLVALGLTTLALVRPPHLLAEVICDGVAPRRL
jgi:hypothetical protein